MIDRRDYPPSNSVKYIWETLELPEDALNSLDLAGGGKHYASSFKVDHLAHATVALSALAASLVWSARTGNPLPRVSVSKEHACAEYVSERLYTLDGERLNSPLGTIGGLHKTADGHVRMHDGFPHHRDNALMILGLQEGANRDEVARKMLEWKSVDLETAAFKGGAVIVALRSFKDWDALPQSKIVPDFPITLRRIQTENPSILPASYPTLQSSCLEGIRVVELSRVIAAPVAGRTLAAHGADVIWVRNTSASNPVLTLPLADRQVI